jgi:hypothetical protein
MYGLEQHPFSSSFDRSLYEQPYNSSLATTAPFTDRSKVMQIVGLGEVLRFDSGAVSKKEMRVLLPDGTEHGVSVPEDVVQRLLDLWLNHQGARTKPFVRPTAPAELTIAHFDEPDAGEVTDSSPPPSAQPVVTPVIPRPKFLEDDTDEDGNQI